jgi:hypothetical protein
LGGGGDGETAFLAELRNEPFDEGSFEVRKPGISSESAPQTCDCIKPALHPLNSVILRQSMANNGVNGKKQAD